MLKIHFKVEGRVQGVYYRQSAIDVAQRLGLRGWVRNRRDGSVEILATGDEEALNEFLGWCRIGPEAAKVAALEIMDEDDSLPLVGNDFRKEVTL
jgi:acylphosphatase